MPATRLRGSYQTASLSSFDLSTPRDVISLWIKRSVANGIRSFWICDYQENMERFRYFAKIAKAEGAEIVTSLMYTSSPLHTDEHWVAKTRLIAGAKDCIDRIMISDESGIITPERTRELVAIVQRNCEGIPLEFHSHCNSGLAPLCYLAAVQAGVRTLHTAVAPLANGSSLPATESVLKNLRRLGYESDLDEDALAEVSAHFRQIAEKEGLPTRQADGVRPLSLRAPGAGRHDHQLHAAAPRDQDGAPCGRDPRGGHAGAAGVRVPGDGHALLADRGSAGVRERGVGRALQDT